MPALDSISKKTPDGHGLSAPSCSALFYVYGKNADSPVKIGWTSNLKVRLRIIKAHSPIKGEMLHTLEFPDQPTAFFFEDTIKKMTKCWETESENEWRMVPRHVFEWLTALDSIDAGIVAEYAFPETFSLAGLLSDSQKQILPDRRSRFLRITKSAEESGSVYRLNSVLNKPGSD